MLCFNVFLGLSIDYSTNKLWWVNNATQPSDYIMSCSLDEDCTNIQGFPYAMLKHTEAPTALATYNGKLYITVGKKNGLVYVVDEDGTNAKLLRRNVSDISMLKMFIKETNIHS